MVNVEGSKATVSNGNHEKSLSEAASTLKRILMVDDEPNVLQGYKRQLHKNYELVLAHSGEEGLKALEEDGPFAVVVSDQKMPGMDGVTFLAAVRKQYPDIVRMMLSGQADLDETIAAVNEGNIFRFISKPSTPEILSKALDAAIRQYSLMVAEVELLDKTLKGSIQSLVEVLSLANPHAFGRSTRVNKVVKQMAINMDYPLLWELEMATLLSNLGMITVPDKILTKVFMGKILEKDEKEIFSSHPVAGYKLLNEVPRLGTVAKWVKDQSIGFDRAELQAAKGTKLEQIVLGRNILNLGLEFDHLVAIGNLSEAAAVAKIINNSKIGKYNTEVVDALKNVIFPPREPVEVHSLNEIKVFMTTAEAIQDEEGNEIIPEGQLVNQPTIQKLKNLESSIKIKFPIQMWVED
ncbi:hypothetical protein SCG7109_AA_00510 [Chlamydiales bacterium SCGC AG-110-M15]|nr:hypothetical protein SCG7109_AA_00510 [Chlamydiales bacterium SCGC AG-110-M15]